jgi:hypothetical protein
MGKNDWTVTPSAEGNPPALSPEAAALLEGFKGITNELKQSRLDAPDVQAKAMKKAMRPSNDTTHGISAFNPRGEKDFPMPPLKCEIRAPWSIHPAFHGLDREEVELFNRLEAGEYDVELNDGTVARVYVKARINEITEKLERLDMETAPRWTNENKSLFPAMRVMLRSMLGDGAAGVMTMATEHRKIAAKELAVSVGE